LNPSRALPSPDYLCICRLALTFRRQASFCRGQRARLSQRFLNLLFSMYFPFFRSELFINKKSFYHKKWKLKRVFSKKKMRFYNFFQFFCIFLSRRAVKREKDDKFAYHFTFSAPSDNKNQPMQNIRFASAEIHTFTYFYLSVGFYAVIGRFFCDVYVVRVGLAQSGA